MGSWPLAPIEQVAIIWACCSSHLDMSLDMGLWVFPQRCAFLIFEYPALAVIHMPVFVRYPCPAFVWVSGVCPCSQLQIEDMATVVKRFCCHYRPVIIGPSTYHLV